MNTADKKLHGLLSDYLVSGKEAKKTPEWEWFVRKNFVDGNHWVQWNSEAKRLETVGSDNKFRVTINKIYSVVRAVRAYVTKYEPKWEVMGMNSDEKVYNKARGAEKLLDMYYFEENIKRKLKEVVFDALYASVGHLWFWWDGEFLRSISVNPFDFIPDPTAKDYTEYTDALFVARAYVRKTEDIKRDPMFRNRDAVVPDNLLASSDIKSMLIQMSESANVNAAKARGLNTTVCYEVYYRSENGQENDLGGKINHSVITANAVLLNEPTRFIDMPVRTYHTDTEGGKQYTAGWVKNMIPENKMIDTLESQTLEYNHVVSKGRYVTDKGSGVGSVVNANGQIITKNRGSYFEQLPMQSQPATVESQINRAAMYIEDIGASHDAFIGRMPTGANSGVAIQTLLYGEENNLHDLRDNMNDFLISTAKLILRSFSRQRVDPIVIFSKEPSEKEPEAYAVVGDSSPVKKEEEIVTYNKKTKKVKIERIVEENNIQVTIGTWLGTGKIDAQDKLMKLSEMGIIDMQTVLEFYNAPNIPAIMERIKKQKTEEATMQAAVSNPAGTMPAIETGMDGSSPMNIAGGLSPVQQP